MAIEVTVDADAVNAMVTQAILDSALGGQISKAIDTALKGQGYGKSLIEQAVEAAIHEQVRLFCRELVRDDETAEKIRAAIRAGLTDERLGKLTDEFVAQLGLLTVDDMRRRT